MSNPQTAATLNRFRAAPFVLAALCFLLPFVTISCKQDPQMVIHSVTGLQLVAGSKMETKDPMTGQTESHPVPPDTLVQIAFGCALLGALLALSKSRASHGLLAGLGVAGVICLFLFKNAPNDTKHATREEQEMRALVEIRFEPGFLIAWAALAAGALANLYLLRRPVPALAPTAPAAPAPSPAAPPPGQPGPGGVPTETTPKPEGPGDLPLPPPPPPPAPPPSKWGKLKIAGAVGLVAVGYLAYPYYVAYTLKQALSKRDIATVADRIDFAALKTSFPADLARRLKIKDQTNPRPAPALQTIGNSQVLKNVVGECLGDRDGFAHLFQPLDAKEPAAGTSLRGLFGAEGWGGSGLRLSVDEARYGSRSWVFFTSLSEFGVTLRDVTLHLKVLSHQYSPTRPFDLEVRVPQVRLLFELSANTWRLHRLEVTGDIPCLATIPWIERSELAGAWNVEGKPQWEVEVPSGPGSEVARLYRYGDNGVMTETLLRDAGPAGGEVRCAFTADQQAGEAVFSKDAKGALFFALDDSEPAALKKAQGSLSAGQLNGLWKPAEGEIMELDLSGDTLGSFSGVVTMPNIAGAKEGSIANVRVAGSTLMMDASWRGSFERRTVAIHRRADGALYVGLRSGWNSPESRYYRMNKLEAASPLTAGDLAGRWETDAVAQADLRSGGSFTARADKRVTAQIGALSFRRSSALLEWTLRSSGVLAVSGTGLIERQTNGQLRMKLETTGPSFESRQAATLRNTVKRACADGAWYSLRPYQPATDPAVVSRDSPSPRPAGPARLPNSLTVEGAQVPPAWVGRCTIAVDPPDVHGSQSVILGGMLDYTNQDQVRLTAPDNIGTWTFLGWGGDCKATGAIAVVTADRDKRLQVSYTPWPGTWVTNPKGECAVQQVNNEVTGAFDKDRRNLRGTADPKRITGTWEDTVTGARGSFEWKLRPDGRSFDGYYTDATLPAVKEKWTGQHK